MRTLLLAVLVAGVPGNGAAGAADARTASPPAHGTGELYGRVVLDDSCTKIGVPAVTFDHWNHRAMYTCRVCHVDAGFALNAGATRASFDSNQDGSHCGACHDGKTLHDGRPIFGACSGWPLPDRARGCLRCHTGANPGPAGGYEAFKRKMPLDEADFLDWAEASRQSIVKPQGSLDGRGAARASMRLDRDLDFSPVGTWMTKVTYSHRKHGAWNGCELCHPEIFPSTKRGAATIRMAEISAGRYCGVCHGKVAFPLTSCQRCHPGDARPLR